MKVLVTGAAGFIGSNLIKHLSAKHREWDIVGVDIFDGSISSSSLGLGSFKNLYDCDSIVYPYDIRSEAFVRFLCDFGPDVIIHLAAESSTLASEQLKTLENNILPFKMLISYSERKCCKLVYASSASVYGMANNAEVLDEDTSNTRPLNLYAYSKQANELMAKSSNAECVGLRFFNVYGQREFSKHSTGSVASQIIKAKLEGEDFYMFDDSGSTYRDFVYIGDVINAIIASISFPKGVYNVCSGQKASFMDVYNALDSIWDLGPAKLKPNPYTSQYQKFTCGSLAKIQRHYSDYQPLSITDGIRNMCNEINLMLERDLAW